MTASWSSIRYSLDIGNNADTGQFVLGQPLNRLNRHNALRLRTIVDLFPDIVNAALDDDHQPSCSAAEALERQHPFINQTLANHALALLSRLFLIGSLQYHGAFEPCQRRRRSAENRSEGVGAHTGAEQTVEEHGRYLTLVQKHAVGGP